MNMIICSEPCRHQCDGCCLLKGAGIITNASLSPCRYFSPKDNDPGNYQKQKKDNGYADRA